jgi:hypothetical protein
MRRMKLMDSFPVFGWHGAARSAGPEMLGSPHSRAKKNDGYESWSVIDIFTEQPYREINLDCLDFDEVDCLNCLNAHRTVWVPS